MSSGLPTVPDLVRSAAKYAKKTLEAHNTDDEELVAIFAATAIEHITKACLVKRNPTLLLSLQGKDNIATLLFLAGVSKEKPKKFITVGLKDAVSRVEDLIHSKADKEHLNQLIDLRDGTIHIADGSSVEMQLVIAFIRQVDASLVDLNVEPEIFWNENSNIVQIFLTNENNRIKKTVEIKIQQARLRFGKKTQLRSVDFQEALVSDVPWPGPGEDPTRCPACKSQGVGIGEHEVIADYEYLPDGSISGEAEVTFHAQRFSCSVCSLHLDTKEEMLEAGIPLSWRSDVDPAEVENFNHYLDLLERD